MDLIICFGIIIREDMNWYNIAKKVTKVLGYE